MNKAKIGFPFSIFNEYYKAYNTHVCRGKDIAYTNFTKRYNELIMELDRICGKNNYKVIFTYTQPLQGEIEVQKTISDIQIEQMDNVSLDGLKNILLEFRDLFGDVNFNLITINIDKNRKYLAKSVKKMTPQEIKDYSEEFKIDNADFPLLPLQLSSLMKKIKTATHIEFENFVLANIFMLHKEVIYQSILETSICNNDYEKFQLIRNFKRYYSPFL